MWKAQGVFILLPAGNTGGHSVQHKWHRNNALTTWTGGPVPSRAGPRGRRQVPCAAHPSDTRLDNTQWKQEEAQC